MVLNGIPEKGVGNKNWTLKVFGVGISQWCGEVGGGVWIILIVFSLAEKFEMTNRDPYKIILIRYLICSLLTHYVWNSNLTNKVTTQAALIK